MKRSLFFLLSLLLLFVVGCADRKEQMLAQLAELERQNIADSLMTNDSLAKALVTYFDDHGTPNERLRAHYILGRTYADLGEAPAALDAYLDAAACADTTAADCDWGKLSRVHAQSAQLYRQLIQLRSQQAELNKAIYYARKASDTLMAIECLAATASVYSLLHYPDSVIYIREEASHMLAEMNLPKAAARVLGSAISAAVDCNDLQRASRYVEQYESASGLFDDEGNVESGRDIYYYTKGRYYLGIGQVDSAEWMFRRLAGGDHSLNEQIGASRGLYEVYLQRRNPDSIAKYANLSYLLNDSAYSLSEMENVQRLKASYNYNRNRQLAEEKSHEARQAKIMLMLAISLAAVVILLLILFILAYRKRQQLQHLQYQHDLANLERAQVELMQLRAEENQALSSIIQQKDEELEEWKRRVAEHQAKTPQPDSALLEGKLQNSSIVHHLKDLLQQNPPCQASNDEMKELWNLMNELIPSFYDELKKLRLVEYHVCLLIRSHFGPAEICKLTGLRDDYLPHLRKRLLQKVYGIEGTAKDFDARIMAIV